MLHLSHAGKRMRHAHFNRLHRQLISPSRKSAAMVAFGDVSDVKIPAKHSVKDEK
jgi:hypothetical protein